MQSIPSQIAQCKKNLSQSTVVRNAAIHQSVKLHAITARKKSKRPLAKLQYILFSIIKEDCSRQQYCDRSIVEFANLSAHSIDGVKKALRVLNKEQYIFTKKQPRGYNSVRVINKENLPPKRDFKKAPQKAPLKSNSPPSILNKISYSFLDQDKTDLLAKDSIIKTTKREEECFKALGCSELDELIILSAIKQSRLSQDERFKLATTIMAANYKNPIQSSRAYYRAAIENHRRTQ